MFVPFVIDWDIVLFADIPVQVDSNNIEKIQIRFLCQNGATRHNVVEGSGSLPNFKIHVFV